MKKVFNRIDIGLFFFSIYCFFGVIINTNISDHSNLRLVINIFRSLSLIGLLFDYFYKKRNSLINQPLKSSLPYLVFLLFAGIIFIHSNSQQLLILSVFILWSTTYQFKTIIRKHKNVILFACLCVVLLAVSGIIPNEINYRSGSNSPRYLLGFIAPTILPAYLMFAILGETYLANFKMNKIKICIYLLICISLSYITGTRLDIFISIMFLFLNLIFATLCKLSFVKKLFNSNMILGLFFLVPIIAIGFNFTMIYLYQFNVQPFINFANILSGRVQYTISALQLVKPGLLGNNIVWEDYNIILDSSYFKYLLEYGIIGFIILVIYYYFLIDKAVKYLDYSILFIFTFILVESIFEPFILDYNYQLFILYISCKVFNVYDWRGSFEKSTISGSGYSYI